MKLDRSVVTHISKLARVELTDTEVDTFSEQLSEILGHFDALNAVDTDGVEPTAQAFTLRNVMVDDVSRPSLPQAEVLALAPNTDDGYLRVRAVLE
jgi:aspartyl-tRNA(Asn)/glutamyl-tRNA(Gln) amidotransferase subunit C